MTVLAPPPPAVSCPATAQLAESVKRALELQKTDAPGARAVLAPLAQACAPSNGAGYVVHVLAADLAARAADWPAARTLLEGVGDRAGPLAPTAAFIRLSADRALGDGDAFLTDRSAMLADNDAGLAAWGRRVETFRAGPFTVTGYEASFDQGPFRRLAEFVATPDDPLGLPYTVTLTDDLSADKVAAGLGAAPAAGQPAKVYFMDLYFCDGHSTLPPAARPAEGGRPTYAAAKAVAVAAFSAPDKVGTLAGARAPSTPGCPAGKWLMPGLTLNGRSPAPGANPP